MKSCQFFIYLLFSCTINLQVAISSDDESTSLIRQSKGKEREDPRGSYFKSPANSFQSATYTDEESSLAEVEVPAFDSQFSEESSQSSPQADKDELAILAKPDADRIYLDELKNFTPFPSRTKILSYYNPETLHNLATQVDKIIFENESKIQQTTCSILGLLCGGAPGHPATGAFMEFVADTLRVPTNSGYADALIAYTTISSYPAFAAQFAGRARILWKSVTDRNKYFYKVKKQDDDIVEDRENSDSELNRANQTLRLGATAINREVKGYQRGGREENHIYDDIEGIQEEYKREHILFNYHRLHYLKKGLLGLTSLFEAALLGSQLYKIEEDFLLSYGFGFLIPFLTCSMGEHIYKVGEKRISRWFYEYFYSRSSQYNNVENAKFHKIRQVLLEDLERTRKNVTLHPNYVDNIYELLFKRSPDNLFKFSVLLTPPAEIQDINIRDSDTLKPNSLKHQILQMMAESLIIGGQYSRFRVTQYMFEAFLTGVGVNTQTAFWISHAVGGLITFHRWYLEHRMHHKNLQKLGNTSWYSCWASLGDKKPIRKSSQLLSLINSALFSLIYTEIGVHAFSKDSLETKSFLLGLGYLLNVSLFFNFFNEKYQDVVTASTTAASCCCGENKAVAINRYIRKSKNLIKEADTKTIKGMAEVLEIR